MEGQHYFLGQVRSDYKQAACWIKATEQSSTEGMAGNWGMFIG